MGAGAKEKNEIFETAQDEEVAQFDTSEHFKQFRLNRFDIGYPNGMRFSTPLESTKRHSLDPSSNSPYNHYSFSSSEAMWKLRLKASDASVLPYENKYASAKKSSVSPIRLKDDLINFESMQKQIKAKQIINKSTSVIPACGKTDMRSERQISDPKKLLDEFMLPHATVMA